LTAAPIFVTGGTGFLGRHLIPLLCRRGIPVRVLTRDPAAHPWLARYPNVQAVAGDVRESGPWMAAVQGCGSVIHAGGLFRFWGAAQDFDATNVTGTRHLLDAARAAGVQRFVHVSSVAVIGQPDPREVIDEAYPPNPVEPYQISKLKGEHLALEAWREHGLPVIVVRPGAYYGPLGEYAFNRLFFKDPMRGIIMQIDGGRHIIFPAYVGDVAQGVLLALERGQVGEVYNLCGDWISHQDAFTIVIREAGLWYPRLNIPGWMGIATSRVMEAAARIVRREPFWPLNLKSYVYNDWRVSNDKARRELGFAPLDFVEGVRRTVQWYRAGKPDQIPETECESL
jgi:dihydroflavonol-4-reductase